MAFLETFGFVTYASMGAWHAAVTKGLRSLLTLTNSRHIIDKDQQEMRAVAEKPHVAASRSHPCDSVADDAKV